MLLPKLVVAIQKRSNFSYENKDFTHMVGWPTFKQRVGWPTFTHMFGVASICF